MSTEAPALGASAAGAAAGSLPLYRILGTLGMLGSPFLFVSFAIDGFDNGDASRAAALVGLLFAVGWFGNVLGLHVLRAAGQRLASRMLLTGALAGVALANVFQVYEAVAPGSDSVFYTITDVAWPLSMLLLLVIGIVMLFARVFEGWLRFTPLFAALWLPVGAICMVAFGETAGLVISSLHLTIGWFLMGYAVRKGGKLTA
jgi:hypothetical protein